MSERIDSNVLNVLKRLSLQTHTLNNSINTKLITIQNASDYTEDFEYEGTTGTDNIISIIYSGTIDGNIETVTKTISYVDETINGSNITKTQLS
jgi:hypothetical protein